MYKSLIYRVINMPKKGEDTVLNIIQHQFKTKKEKYF